MTSPATALQKIMQQIQGITASFQRMLDDDFVFGSAQPVPQVATIFDTIGQQPLMLAGLHSELITLPELLALIAYRYGFDGMRYMGHGGYAIVLGHEQHQPLRGAHAEHDVRRVLRFVPEHHVQDVTQRQGRPFNVLLDEHNEPIRHADYPLLLSDVFLLPRHTTRLMFFDPDGELLHAGGHPAVLHCQLLPEVIPLNSSGLRTPLAIRAGEVLATALAALGVKVADAHGGNGGVLVDRHGRPIIHTQVLPDGTRCEQYIPVVLDYGFYTAVPARMLAALLVQHGIQPAQLAQVLAQHGAALDWPQAAADEAQYAALIAGSGIAPHHFGRLLFAASPPVLWPEIWIQRAQDAWRTSKETTYPALHDQDRLAMLYAAYEEIVFPQRIETYHFTLTGF